MTAPFDNVVAVGVRQKTLMFTWAVLMLLVLTTSSLASEKKAPVTPDGLLEELSQKQQKDHIAIGWIFNSLGANPPATSQLYVIVFKATPEMHLYKIPPRQANDIDKQFQSGHQSAEFTLGKDMQPSPDGKWITYRTHDNKFVLADSTGRVDHILIKGKDVITPLYWSPDSQYLAYIRKGGNWRLFFHCFDDMVDVMVYRIRDGEQRRLHSNCVGFPYQSIRWLQLPADFNF